MNLIRPGAATHSFDQDQRFVPVTFSVVSGGIQVNAPANANLLPPGYYMLFLVSNAGVPSVAKFVRFPAAYEDSEPPSAPGNLQGTGNIGGSTLSWTAATDNVGVVRYEIYRSTTPGFTPSAANFVGQTTGTELHRRGPRHRHLLLRGAGGRRGGQQERGLQSGFGDGAGRYRCAHGLDRRPRRMAPRFRAR